MALLGGQGRKVGSIVHDHDVALKAIGAEQDVYKRQAVAQAKAVIEMHETFRSPAILQGADLANAFMGGRVDFANGTLEDKKRGARNIANAVRKYGEHSPIPVVLHLDHGCLLYTSRCV